MKLHGNGYTVVTLAAIAMLFLHGAVTTLVMVAGIYLNSRGEDLAFRMKALVIFSGLAFWAFAGAIEVIVNRTAFLGYALAGFMTFIIIVGVLTHGTVRLTAAHPILTYLRYFYGILSLALWPPLVAFAVLKVARRQYMEK